MSNKGITDMELARVEEVGGAVNCRWFDATLADGTKCWVSSSPDLYCHRHDAAECEGCRRVAFVLTGEKYKQLKMTLVGYAVGGSDAPTPEKPASHLTLA